LVFPNLRTVDDFKDKYKIQKKIAFTVKNLNTSLKELAKQLNIDKI